MSVTGGRKHRRRYRRILRFAAKHLVANWWFELVLPRIGLGRLVARGRVRRWQRAAREFHALAAELGGLMIKVGQFLSTRLDVLPLEVTRELEGLQDEVEPEDFAEIRRLAEAELRMPLEVAFASFDPQPLAAASLGQAHRARLIPEDAAETGFADVVVKVQRPGIEAVVAVDLAALRRVAHWLSRVRLVSRRVDAPALAEEFARTSLEEIDYLHEASNAERFAAQFAGDARVRVPGIAWERTGRRVLTLEDVTAIKVNDLAGLRDAGLDPAEVASGFAAVMFDQLFLHGFFHADAHPGNLFVSPTAEGFELAFIDFGMMGEIPDSLRAGLRQFAIAVAARDGRRLVATMRELDVLLPSADSRELERVMTALFARFGGLAFTELRGLDERELRGFADEFGDTIRSLPFQLPENFLLVIRAVSLTSGLASTLDHDFNIWNAVEPYAAKLLLDEGGGFLRSLGTDAFSILGSAARLPKRLDGLLARLEEGEIAVESQGRDRALDRIERTAGRLVSAVLFTGLVVAGVLARPADEVLGWVLLGASALPLAHAVLGGLVAARRRR